MGCLWIRWEGKNQKLTQINRIKTAIGKINNLNGTTIYDELNGKFEAHFPINMHYEAKALILSSCFILPDRRPVEPPRGGGGGGGGD